MMLYGHRVRVRNRYCDSLDTFRFIIRQRNRPVSYEAFLDFGSLKQAQKQAICLN